MFHFKKSTSLKVMCDPVDLRISVSNKHQVWKGGGGFRTPWPFLHHCTLRPLLTNVKDKDKLQDRQGAVHKIRCCDCKATYIGETGNLNTWLTEHKMSDEKWWCQQAHCWTPFTDKTSNWLELCNMYYVFYRRLSTPYFRKLVLITNLEQMQLNRSQ